LHDEAPDKKKYLTLTCALGATWGFSLIINCINLGLFPLQAGLVEAVFELIEYPIAITAGAGVYEGAAERGRVTE
jgi:hypothetical protein